MSLKPSLEHVEFQMENYTYLLAILGQEFFVGWPIAIYFIQHFMVSGFFSQRLQLLCEGECRHSWHSQCDQASVGKHYHHHSETPFGCTLREGFKNQSQGICPLGGYPPPPLNEREILAKKVNGKGGYSPPP